MKKIKRNKVVVSVIIGLMCFALVFTMFVQFNTIEQTDLANITTMRETELREELTKWNTRYEELYARYEEEEVKRQEYQNSLGTDDQASDLLEEE